MCLNSRLRNSCAAGAIGGATSALVAPLIANAVTAGQGISVDAQGKQDSIQLAAITALTVLAGGATAAALGQDVTVAANAAQNEISNNSCGSAHPNCGNAFAKVGLAIGTGLGLGAGALLSTGAATGATVLSSGANGPFMPTEIIAGTTLGGLGGGLAGAAIGNQLGNFWDTATGLLNDLSTSLWGTSGVNGKPITAPQGPSIISSPNPGPQVNGPMVTPNPGPQVNNPIFTPIDQSGGNNVLINPVPQPQGSNVILNSGGADSGSAGPKVPLTLPR